MNGEDSEEEEAGGGQAKAFSISPLVLGHGSETAGGAGVGIRVPSVYA